MRKMTKVDLDEARSASHSFSAPAAQGKIRDDRWFRNLFDEHGSTVYRYFSRKGFSLEDSMDLTQETFLEALRSWDNYRGDASHRTWLFAIMNNVWKQTLRKLSAAKRDAAVISFEDWILDGEASRWEEQTGLEAAGEPLDQALSRERSEWVRDALVDLPESMRECILLRLDQGLKYKDIAALLKMPIGSVKSQLYQAREKLRENLAGKTSR